MALFPRSRASESTKYLNNLKKDFYFFPAFNIKSCERSCILPRCVFWQSWAPESRWSLWMRSSPWLSSYSTSDSSKGSRPYWRTASLPRLVRRGQRRGDRVKSHDLHRSSWRLLLKRQFLCGKINFTFYNTFYALTLTVTHFSFVLFLSCDICC